MNNEVMLHFVGGGVAGTISAAVTCPLEVVKTRLQSSSEKPKLTIGSDVGSFVNGQVYRTRGIGSVMPFPRLMPLVKCSPLEHVSSAELRLWQHLARNLLNRVEMFDSYRLTAAAKQPIVDRVRGVQLVKHFRTIVQNEGVTALWKGLGPILVGVVPSRAIYFCTYGNTKHCLNDRWTPNSVPVHMASAASAGLVTSTFSNPIWMIKTRLQLDNGVGERKMNTVRCIKQIYQEYGLRGFLKGVTASYAGVSETMIHFVTYERLKAWFFQQTLRASSDVHGSDFLPLMVFGGIARMVAAIITYPHELARTRLREKGNKYTGFCNVIIRVFREESWRALYNGMGVHLVKTIPNSAVLMATYELTVYLLKH